MHASNLNFEYPSVNLPPISRGSGLPSGYVVRVQSEMQGSNGLKLSVGYHRGGYVFCRKMVYRCWRGGKFEVSGGCVLVGWHRVGLASLGHVSSWME